MTGRGDATVRETASGARILEIVFVGKHEHIDSHGMGTYLEEQIDLNMPAAVVLNLIDFKYSWGNDMGNLFGPLLLKPFCIIAEGVTARSLQSLLGPTRLPQWAEACYFKDPEEGFQYLDQELAEGKE